MFGHLVVAQRQLLGRILASINDRRNFARTTQAPARSFALVSTEFRVDYKRFFHG
jgi:hypothetical protein